MESTLRIWMNSPYSWALLALIAVISLILAIYFGLKSIRYQRFTYAKSTNKLVSLKNSTVKSLHLFFDKEEITDVSITKIAVWNSGNEKIDSIDVVESEPLRVCIREGYQDDTRLLDCSIIYETDRNIFYKQDPSSFKVIENIYEIPFDFMAPADGMVIQVIHTGDGEGVVADCSIKGGKKIIELEANSEGIFEPKVCTDSFPLMRKLPKWLQERLGLHERISKFKAVSFYYVMLVVFASIVTPIIYYLPIYESVKNVIGNLLGVSMLLYGLILVLYLFIYLFFSKVPKKFRQEL